MERAAILSTTSGLLCPPRGSLSCFTAFEQSPHEPPFHHSLCFRGNRRPPCGATRACQNRRPGCGPGAPTQDDPARPNSSGHATRVSIPHGGMIHVQAGGQALSCERGRNSGPRFWCPQGRGDKASRDLWAYGRFRRSRNISFIAPGDGRSLPRARTHRRWRQTS